MQVPQKREYFGLKKDGERTAEEEERLKANLQRMRATTTQFGKQHPEVSFLQVSFLTRASAMEVCFGDPEEDEPNIAASILRSILKLNLDARVLTSQNIVLAGGSCMVPGFKLRVLQEMKYLIEHYAEFKELETIKERLQIPDNQFPPNCMAWVGASLVASLNTEIERFMTSAEEFTKNGERLPDRFGEAYLFATRSEPYLNPDFEYKNQYAKQALYSSMSPYSARSYQEKKMSITQQIDKQMQFNIKTPTSSNLGSQFNLKSP
uniref:Uncharacterized protein n=1 Tax=Strombidium rassoulzadegani TaxID=1082188 RepID=A0A7S3CI43_9SPIT|mmetsp:Transcript_11042/g.18468  ORF Transcript_11042/g.18468 Transcript_11042/m.18468 type:complete len:264 (+) Transcript_11042:751-1542(+)